VLTRGEQGDLKLQPFEDPERDEGSDPERS